MEIGNEGSMYKNVEAVKEKTYEAKNSFDEIKKGKFTGIVKKEFSSNGQWKTIKYFYHTGVLNYWVEAKIEDSKHVGSKMFNEISDKPIMESAIKQDSPSVYLADIQYSKYATISLPIESDEIDYIHKAASVRDKLNRTKKKIYKDKKKTITKLIEYSSNNSVSKIKITTEDTEGKTNTQNIKYDYTKFDKHENWTERITYTEGIATNIVTRQYTYY